MGESPFVGMAGIAYFAGVQADTGIELWRTDGTLRGTYLVADLNPLAAGSGPRYLTKVGSLLYFRCNYPDKGDELCQSDGTESGTVLTSDINQEGSNSSNPDELTLIGSTLYFVATDGGTGDNHGRELWKRTATATSLLKDIRTGILGSYPQHLAMVGSLLLFTATDDSGVCGLWKSNGTETGTKLLKSFAPSCPFNLTALGSLVYFTASDGSAGYELWKSNGTAAGTVMVKDINPSGSSTPEQLTAAGANLYFSAYNGASWGLYKQTGALVKALSEEPTRLTAMGSTLYFYSGGLWKSNGTAAGTTLINGDLTSMSYPTVIGTTLFFRSSDGTHNGVWRTNGTAATTYYLGDIGGPTTPTNLSKVGTRLYFTASDASSGTEPWVYFP